MSKIFDDSNVAYIKYKHYVITIILDKRHIKLKLELTPFGPLYQLNNRRLLFKIINIEDIACNFYEKTDDDRYKVNNTYVENINYYLLKEAAYFRNFMKEKQYQLISDNYSGYYKNYDMVGNLIEEYYHVNGKKQGTYKKYYNNKNIEIETSYIDNKLNGEYKSYHDSGKINEICYYQNNNRVGECKRYDENNNLIFKCKYNDNGTMMR
jgi:antitoxin component YwqK of YwqJK toxin-antitoxin module